MIALARHEIRQLAMLVMLANTPQSLYLALSRDPVVDRLVGSVTYDHLADYFESITARGRTSDLALGIAYAVAVALLTHGTRSAREIPFHRLLWGKEFRQLARLGGTVSNVSDVYAPQYQATKTDVTSSPSSGLIILSPSSDLNG